MPEPSDPFPTLFRLAEEYGVDVEGYKAAAAETKRAIEKLREVISDVDGGPLLGQDVCLVVCGSFARHEMQTESDCDWTLLIDGVVDSSHSETAVRIRQALDEKGVPQPGSSGIFGNLIFSHELVHRIGGAPDSTANLTRRMSMILESQAITRTDRESSVVWNNVLSNILERYFEQDIHFAPTGERRVPRFLLNDLTRYWRTIGVDYAAKVREQDGQKWAIRNAKLRLSRKLLFAAGLAFCYSCQLSPPSQTVSTDLFGSTVLPLNSQQFVQNGIKFTRTTSLEYLAGFVDAFAEDAQKPDIVKLLFGAYNDWLSLMSDASRRDELTTLQHDQAAENEVFQQVKEIGNRFAKGLRILFFGRSEDTNPIANLSLDYVGF